MKRANITAIDATSATFEFITRNKKWQTIARSAAFVETTVSKTYFINDVLAKTVFNQAL